MQTPEPTPAPEPEPTPAPEPTPEPTPAPVTAAEIISETTNTIETEQSSSVDISITLKNTGTTAWDSDYTIRPTEASEEFLASSTDFSNIPLGKTVSPDETITLTFPLQIPENPGKFTLGLVLGDSDTIISGSEVLYTLLVNQKPPVDIAYNQAVARENATPAQLALAKINPPEQTIKATTAENEGLISAVAASANRFFLGFLVFITAALILNIVIRIRVQQGHVIAQVMVVVVLAGVAFFTQFSFLENIGSVLKII